VNLESDANRFLREGLGTMNIRERRERLWISKLERLPCFEQMVKKLANGQSVTSVVLWARSVGTDSDLGRVGFETWRKYITALSIRIQATLRAESTPQPKNQEQIIQKVRELADSYDVPLTDNGRRLWRLIKKSAKDWDSETALKYLFAVQQSRVQSLIDWEEKTGILSPGGDKQVAVLMQIAAEVRKLEISQHLLRGKVPTRCGPSLPRELFS
jgi:hypothetical protein